MCFFWGIYDCIFLNNFKLKFPCASVCNCSIQKNVVFVIGFFFPLCVLMLCFFSKYSENYEIDILFRILLGYHKHIFYTSAELNLLPLLFALFYLPNAVRKPLISQPLMLNQSKQSFPKYARICQK